MLVHGQRISLFQGFEQLLCLESVKIDHYPYQIDTARRVLQRFGGRAILADEVGLGKTIEAGLILKEYFLRGLVSRVLILTVPSLVLQWKEEIETKFDLKFMTTDDPEFETEGTNFWIKYNLIIASVHTAKRENHRQIIHQIEYDLLIIDEAHHLKSKSTLSWQFVNEIKKKFALLLTATPVQNNLEELYNMITLLKPGQLKTLTAFKRDFVTRGNSKKPKNKEQLRELLAEVMIRNTRSQVDIKLPPRHARTVKIHLLPQEMAIYQRVSEFIKNEYSADKALNKFLLMMLQREIGSSIMAVRPTLKKMSENPNSDETKRKTLLELYHEASEINEGTKTNALLKIIHSINGEKCLIFTQFRETQRVIHQCLNQAGISTSLFNGQMTSLDKNLSIKEFQQTNQVLISTEAGGEGRNLQFCHMLLNYDLPWNPMIIEQRIGRICRVGQKNQTYVFNLSSQDTIEAYILKILDEKINMFELVIGEMDMILGNLDENRGFEETIMDIWTGSASTDELEGKIQEFGNQLQSAKQSYMATKELEEALFGEDYEVE
ncbi:DEAD/DEAH box helicase [bacterium]|nr:DEAD/DEAH box helicase [bacterium]MBU1753589.1 DEAD/DEAH box helicase [bacterium]